ncbi:bifunctional diguanylate cyclase/phosphodiesterase [Silvimonas soli]|uniref:bifunctional diguanylate cyclase/phosphodiesterase n=1 Tax=Silvimonas soli TaxID=2980100 RepID=UPI0024B3BC3B|nr:EAL domain-containing protein [Silvimonas soli]
MVQQPRSSQEQDAGHSFSQIRKILISLFLLVLLFALGVIAWSIYRSYLDRVAAAEQQMLTLARSLDEHVGRTLDASVESLYTLRNDEKLRACLTSTDRDCLHEILKKTASRFTQVSSYSVISANGDLLASSTDGPLPDRNLAQTRYFRVASAQPNLPWYVGEQQSDPASDASIIPVAANISDQHGGTLGVLVAGLSPGYFYRFYESIDRSNQLTIRLFRDDGILLLRYPRADDEIGRDISFMHFFDSVFSHGTAGVATETSEVDQQTRIFGWRRIQGWPLGVAVGVNRADVLAAWQRSIVINAGIVLLMILAGGLLLVYVLRQLKRLEKAESDLYLTKAAVERGADMALWLDRDGRVCYANAIACQRLGYTEQALCAMRLRDLNPNFRSDTWPRFWNRLQLRKHLVDESMLRTRDGKSFPVEVYSNYIVYNGEEYNCAVARDISERHLAQEAIVRSEQQLRLALEASSTGLFDMPLEGRTPAVTSPEYDRLLGYEPGEMTETFEKWKNQLHADDRDEVLNALRSYYTGAAAQFTIEYRRRTRHGQFHWFQCRGRLVEVDNDGRPTRLIGTVTDITERKQAQDRITELANFDPVTRLANRNLLRDELRLSIASAERRGHALAVLFLDLDRFKTVNDSLGHAAGDEVLKQVAQRLRGAVRKSDILARLGGDEFVVVLTEIQSMVQAADVASHILAVFAEPFELEVGSFATSTSIGISIYPDDNEHPDTLIRNADVAMYQAKASGRNNFQFFTADLNARASERLQLETSMRLALTNQEFVLHYQPQVSVPGNRIIGAEALIRWQHPEQGLIPPSRFIPIAEDSRMIVAIGTWVLQTACRQAGKWQAAGLAPMTIAVNLSPLQLHQPNLPEIVAEALADSGLDAQYLELEITESVIMQEGEQVTLVLHRLKKLGVKLSIDDFGTGYSSLSYLKRFAFDKLKVDQSFVRDLTTDPNDEAIVLAIIGLGKTLGMAVLAEGVETAEQLAFLKLAGIDSVQGYLLSRPITAETFEALVTPALPLSQQFPTPGATV